MPLHPQRHMMSAMGTAATPLPSAVSTPWRLRTLLGLTWLAALAGGGVLVAENIETAPSRQAAAPAAKSGALAIVGQRISTSFGSMSVDYAYRLTGSSKPMGVIAGRGEIPLQVGVTVTNMSKQPLPVGPGMFRLPDAAGRVVVGRLPGGRIESLSQHRLTLRYAAPAGAQLPPLEVRDPAGGAALRVDLGASSELYELDVRTHRPTKPTP